jgi:phage shock protein E
MSMRRPLFLLALFGLGGGISGTGQAATPPANPHVDADSYVELSRQALELRKTHRVSEEDFIRMSREPGTIVLDARSREKFDLLHISGAINLNFADVTVASLAQVLPNKSTRVLIYCNNNFVNNEAAFPAKAESASLNVPTFIMLYTYGYKNVYELAPLLDAKHTKLKLEPTR